MEEPSAELRRDGIWLSRWSVHDLDECVQVVTESLDHLIPWMAWAAGYTRDTAATYLRDCVRKWAAGTAFDYAIRSESGAIIGSVSLMTRIGGGGLETGYWLHPEHTGKGVITRAVAVLVDEAFRIGANRVEIVHDAANTRSGAVPRRLGFTEVARRSPPQKSITSGELGIDVVWRLTREHYKSLRIR